MTINLVTSPQGGVASAAGAPRTTVPKGPRF